MERRSIIVGSSSGVRKMSVAIFVVALFVRVTPLGLYVTPDEPVWVLRSIRFLDAVASGDLASIPQTGHPGFTTMALGSLGVWLTSQLRPEAAAEHLAWLRCLPWLTPENDAAFPHLAFFLPAGRMLVAVTTSLGIVGVYRLGRRRLGTRAARLLALFLALDPFSAGLSGLLHTDALQATFALLAVMLALPQRSAISEGAQRPLRGARWASLVGTAFFLALAGVTKTLGLLIAPGVAFALLLLGQGSWRDRVVRVIALTLITTLLLVLLYPPFWVSSEAALEALLSAVNYHGSIGLRPVFFLGEVWLNPGPWFYPAVLLFRLTPPIFVALLLGFVRWLQRVKTDRSQGPSRPLSAGWFLLPAGVYLAGLTFASKKFDRYALTSLVLLAPIAAIYWRGAKRFARLVILSALLLPWALVAIAPLYYATPLFGGGWVARQIVPLGWGEATGFAARILNRTLPTPETATIMAENVTGAAPIFEGRVWPWDETRLPCADALIRGRGSGVETHVPLTDVYAAGLHLATVGLPATVVNSELPVLAPGPLPGVAPTAVAPMTDTAHLQTWLVDRYGFDTPFLWIHAPACYPLAESQIATALGDPTLDASLECEPLDAPPGLAAERCQLLRSPSSVAPYITDFGGVVDLVAAAWDGTTQASDAFAVHLRWRPTVPLSGLEGYIALETEVDGETLTWVDGARPLIAECGTAAAAWQPGAMIDTQIDLALPPELPPGEYALTLRLMGNGARMGHTLADGAFGGTELALGWVNVAPSPHPAPSLDLPLETEIPLPGLRLTGAVPPETSLWPGERAYFRLGFERISGEPLADLEWQLWCEGEQRDGGVLDWGPSSPDVWTVGHRYLVRYAPRLAPDLEESTCQFVVADGGDQRIPLTDLYIRSRTRRFDLPTQPMIDANVGVGEFGRLLGADISTAEIEPGAAFTLTLYWQALATVKRSYTVFVHVVGPDGVIWGQSDSLPAKGEAPTTSWVPGEIVLDTHTVSLHESAPPGKYGIFIGIYDAKRGTRQPLYQGDVRLEEDRARLVTLSVVK